MRTSRPASKLAFLVPSFAVPIAGLTLFTLAGCSEPEPGALVPPAPAHVGVDGKRKKVPAIATVEILHADAIIEEREPAPVVPAEPEAEPAVAHKSLYDVEALVHAKEGVDYLAQGRQLLEEGKPGEAVSAFRHALYDADEAGVWANLGEAYQVIGDRARAHACFEEALKRDPLDGATRASLVRAYLQAGEGERARAHVEALMRSAGDDASVRYLQGRVYMKLSMWNEAIVALGKAVERDPKSPWARNNLGFAALMVGENQLALEHLEAILELAPVRPSMLNNLGIAYERLGRGPDALAAFLRAVELKPDYTNALVNKERVRRQLTEQEQELARQILEEMREPAKPASTMASATAPTVKELE